MAKAIRAGYEFNIFDDEELSHVSLDKTNSFVEVNGAYYAVYRGTTFEESQKIDALLDIKGGLSVSDYAVASPFQEKDRTASVDVRDIDAILEQLESMFGGYVGEGDLIDEISWVINEIQQEREAVQTKSNLLAQYQAEIVNVCRDLGCKPNVAISDPAYYGNMIDEAILNLQAEKDELKKRLSIFDPKGNIVLEDFGRNALVVRTGSDGEILPKSLQPYVIAHDYEAKTGEWSHGSYFSDLGHAYETADPDIIEQASIRWQRNDLMAALEEAGVTPTEIMVTNLLSDVSYMHGWRDVAISRGNEMLSDRALDYAKSQQVEKNELPTCTISLADRANDAQKASQELNNFGDLVEQHHDIEAR